jgi:lipoprotein NlpI
LLQGKIHEKYVRSKRLLAGDKAPAMDYFQKSVATNMKDYVEYTSAMAELKFLNAQKN